jgi:hypothetical protein
MPNLYWSNGKDWTGAETAVSRYDSHGERKMIDLEEEGALKPFTYLFANLPNLIFFSFDCWPSSRGWVRNGVMKELAKVSRSTEEEGASFVRSRQGAQSIRRSLMRIL